MGCNSSQDAKKVEEAQSNGKEASANTDNHVPESPEKIQDISEDITTPAKSDIKSDLDNIEFGEEEEKAATKIQAVFRGHQVRKTFIPVDERTVDEAISPKRIVKPTESKEEETIVVEQAKEAIQEENKMSAGKAVVVEHEPSKAELEAEFNPEDKELCHAATKIQASFRGHQVRKEKQSEKPSKPDEPTKELDDELADIDLTDPDLNKAATKIQASFRGHKIEEPEEEIDIDLTDPEVAKVASKIQATFRGHKFRKGTGK